MADRYWVSGSSQQYGTWSDTANWSNAIAGAGGFSVPGPGDHAYFKGKAGSSYLIQVNFDTASPGCHLHVEDVNNFWLNSDNYALTTATFSDITISNPTLALAAWFTFSVNITVTGTLTTLGYSPIYRVKFIPDRDIPIKTMTVNAISLENTDFKDIAAAGAAAPFSGVVIGEIGCCTNITGTAPVTRYWIGDTGSMSDPTHWSTTSGGLAGTDVPLPQDPIVFDENSFSGPNERVDFDMHAIGDFDCSAITEITYFDIGNGMNFNGDFIIGSNFRAGNNNGQCDVQMIGPGTSYITTNGTLLSNLDFYIQTNTGTVRLTDNFTSSSYWNDSFYFRKGTFYTDNHDLTYGWFAAYGYFGADMEVYLGSSTIETGGWDFEIDPADPNLTTLNAGTSTIITHDDFIHLWNDQTYYNLVGRTDLNMQWTGGSSAVTNTLTFNSIVLETISNYGYFWFNHGTQIVTNSFIANGTDPVHFTIDGDGTYPLDVTRINSASWDISYCDINSVYADGDIPVDATVGCIDNGLNQNFHFGNRVLSTNVSVIPGVEYRVSFRASKTGDSQVSVKQGTETVYVTT